MVLLRTKKVQRLLKPKSKLQNKQNNKVVVAKKDDKSQKMEIQKKKLSDVKKSKENVKNNKKLNQKLKQIKEGETDLVEHFDDQGYFIVPDQIQISKEDEKLLEQFTLQANYSQILSTNIDQNIENKQQDEFKKNILQNPQVKVVYSDIAKIMKSFRSGKLPRPFKIIPNTEQWLDLIQITNPKEWSFQGYYAATKQFASNLDMYRAKIFFEKFLVPKIQEDIKKNKKLNYHLYQSIKKAIYKPAAWFKGLIFPLIVNDKCTLKEAQIIGSILKKMSIPSIYSSVALLQMTNLNYTGPIGIIMKTLLEKRYSLPNRVLNGLIDYFCKYKDDERDMPVIWHQMLLKFIELYQPSFSEMQKSLLKQLVSKKNHHLISSEIIKAINGEIKLKNDDKIEIE